MLLVVLAGCHTAGTTLTDKIPLTESSRTPVASVSVPAAPRIRDPKLPAMRGADEQRIARIAIPLSMVEQQLSGEGEDPLWNYSDLFDDSQMANAIDLALQSKNNAKVMQLGGQRALGFVERLEALNASLSDLSDVAGTSKNPIQYVISREDFRYQIALKERGIAAALSETPGISKAYVEWVFKVADIADPNKIDRRVPGGPGLDSETGGLMKQAGLK
jgi:hypothetical protein